MEARRRGTRQERGGRLEAGVDLVLVAGLEGELAEAEAFHLVVFVVFCCGWGGGVGGLPTPFTDGNKLERHAFFP